MMKLLISILQVLLVESIHPLHAPGNRRIDVSPTIVPLTKSAVAVMKTDTIEGRIVFTQVDSLNVHVTGSITGLSPGDHGFHVHTRGDLTDGCTSVLGHFNPTMADNVSMREVGDLGVLVADSEGKVEIDMMDQLIKLSGPHNIVGRSVVVHEGAGGARLACALIGILEEETVVRHS